MYDTELDMGSTTCRQVTFSLSIPADEYLRVYQGAAKNVWTIDHRGQSIIFPVNILQPYVARDGVHGVFSLYFDQQNKFQKIEQIGYN